MLVVGGGDLWLTITPRGKRGFFYEKWTFPGQDWFKMSVAATENARIPAKFLEEVRHERGSMWVGPEYLCEFAD